MRGRRARPAPGQHGPLRIVEVVRGLGLGGAETLIYQRLKYATASGLIRAGDTTVINTYPEQSYFAERIASLGVSIHNTSSSNRMLSSLDLWRAIQRMDGDRVVVVHSPFPAAVIKARTALKRLPFPIVEVSHSTRYAKPTLALGRAFNRYVDLCIAVSDDVAKAPTTTGFRRKSVILAGADRSTMRRWVLTSADTARQMRESIGVVGDAALVVAVGSLTAGKGHRHLISALAELEDSRVHVAIIGAGEQRSALEQQIRSLGVEAQAHLLGRQDDAWRWTAVADLLAHPSYREGLPVALIEARVLNVPIVASDVGGTAQVLAGSEGSRLVEPGDNRALAQAVREVLTQVGPFAEVFPDRATELTPWDMSRYAGEFYEAIMPGRTVTPALS
jgi:glycosyltransferase involved in cell wall biosynthesis